MTTPTRTSGAQDSGREKTDVTALASVLGDQLIGPDDVRYLEARAVWNGMIDRKPIAVARCRGAADVMATVRFAGSHVVPLAVRGGGHNVAGFATCEGGLVADLSAMRGIRVDPARRVAHVQAGATWGDLDRETQAFGLVAPGGIVSTTGVAGLTLGGGQGWLRRSLGMTCHSVISADVVTADGELVTASASEHPDLFWALRGGGGNFGVVTSFEFRLAPLGPQVMFACPVYSAGDARDVLAGMRRYLDSAPDTVTTSAIWWTIPAAPDFPEPLHGTQVLSTAALYAGDPDTGQTVLQPLRELAQPVADLSGVMPYTQVQRLFDAFFPAHVLRYYWKSIYLSRLDEKVTSVLARAAAGRPSPLSMLSVWGLGGALHRTDPDESAAGRCEAPYLVEILGTWADAAGDAENVAWVRDTFAALEPFGTGRTNMNFPGWASENAATIRSAVGGNYERLAEVKARYDPTNLFHLNQNIAPSR